MVSLHTVTRHAPKASEKSGRAATTTSCWTVLVHGLDSSSHTWEDTMERLRSPCLAVDQRGCGYSPLGDPDEFSQEALVADLRRAVVRRCRGAADRVILVGHSLGGRVALAYAATYPDRVAALIIEDMDIGQRDPQTAGIIRLRPYDGVFDRRRATKQAVIRALTDAGYPSSFIDKALDSGRIAPSDDGDDNTWWSQVNPDFRKFCYPHVLNTNNGRRDCAMVAQNAHSEDAFDCHVLVAGTDGTVCDESSIREMKDMLRDRLVIHRFPNAGHSIHSDAPEEFVALLQSVIDRVGRDS